MAQPMSNNLPRRRNLRLTMAYVACVLGTTQLVTPGHAQPYPNKPVRLVHGFASGSAIDVFSRPLAQKLTESLGQQVVVDGRPGATGRTRAVNRAPACGM